MYAVRVLTTYILRTILIQSFNPHFLLQVVSYFHVLPLKSKLFSFLLCVLHDRPTQSLIAPHPTLITLVCCYVRPLHQHAVCFSSLWPPPLLHPNIHLVINYTAGRPICNINAHVRLCLYKRTETNKTARSVLVTKTRMTTTTITTTTTTLLVL